MARSIDSRGGPPTLCRKSKPLLLIPGAIDCCLGCNIGPFDAYRSTDIRQTSRSIQLWYEYCLQEYKTDVAFFCALGLGMIRRPS